MGNMERNEHSVDSKRRAIIGMVPSIIVSGCSIPKSDTQSNNRRTNSSAGSRSPPRITRTTTATGFEPSPFTGTPEFSKAPTFKLGGGDIDVHIFSDYAEEESFRFWTQTWPQIRHYAAFNRINIRLYQYPKPVNKWSMFMPCAALELGAQLGGRKFDEFHFWIYEDLYPDFDIRDIEVKAGAMGADEDKVIQAGKNRKRRAHLEKIAEYAKLVDVSEPLGVVIEDQKLENPTTERIENEIESHLDDDS